MTYLDLVGKAIRRYVPDDVLPDGDTDLLFCLYAVLALAKGVDVTTADVHNAWSAWMQTSDPEHESIRPFEDLDLEQQIADEPYVKAIRTASRTRDWESR
jgi:hypothetical protein